MQNRPPNDSEGNDEPQVPQRRPKTPPVELTQRGPMFPDDQRPDDYPLNALPPGRGYQQQAPVKAKGSQNLAVMLAVFAIVCLVAISFLMMSKFVAPVGLVSVVDVQQGQLAIIDEELHKANTGVIPRLETMLNSMANYVKASDLSGYATTGLLNSKADKSELQSLLNKITGLETQLAEAKADIAELQEGITTPPATGTPGATEVTATLQYFFPSMSAAFPVTGGNVSGSGDYRLEITNNSGVIAKDVQLQVYFYGSAEVNYTKAELTPKMVFGSTTMPLAFGNQVYPDKHVLSFGNAIGLTLNPGETKTFDVTFKVEGSIIGDATSVSYTPYIFVAD